MSKAKKKTSPNHIHVPATYFRMCDLIYWNNSETGNLHLFILPFDGTEMCVYIEEYYRDNIASYKHTEVKNYCMVWSIIYECIKKVDLKRSVHLMFIGPYIIAIVDELMNERPTWCHLLFYFTNYVRKMFRTLIYPSSGACDCVDELPHRSQAPEDGYINVRNMSST